MNNLYNFFYFNLLLQSFSIYNAEKDINHTEITFIQFCKNNPLKATLGILITAISIVGLYTNITNHKIKFPLKINKSILKCFLGAGIIIPPLWLIRQSSIYIDPNEKHLSYILARNTLRKKIYDEKKINHHNSNAFYTKTDISDIEKLLLVVFNHEILEKINKKCPLEKNFELINLNEEMKQNTRETLQRHFYIFLCLMLSPDDDIENKYNNGIKKITSMNTLLSLMKDNI